MEHNHTGQEHANDLAEFQAALALEYKLMYSAMQMIYRMDEQELRNTGNKTHEAAMMNQFKYSKGKVDKLTKEYRKKYLDCLWKEI